MVRGIVVGCLVWLGPFGLVSSSERLTELSESEVSISYSTAYVLLYSSSEVLLFLEELDVSGLGVEVLAGVEVEGVGERIVIVSG